MLQEINLKSRKEYLEQVHKYASDVLENLNLSHF